VSSPHLGAAQGEPAFDAHHPPQRALIDTCVHCGFCLPSCPTYALWGEEMDSPRGRIYLMSAALDGRTAMTGPFVSHFDACLGCMACVTACPSGVQYSPLIEATRGQIERRYDRAIADRLFRALIFTLFPYPGRLRIALAPLALLSMIRGDGSAAAFAVRPTQPAGAPVGDRAKIAGRSAPGFFARLGAMLELAPSISVRALRARTAARTAAVGERRLTVGLLTGCVQRVVFPQVNAATVEVLAAEGCEVVAPPQQGCCGALALHAGRLDEARAFARRTIEVFERAGVERIAVNAAGCGSSMKEYGQLLADDPAWAERAGSFAARVRDVSEVLAEIGEPRARRHPIAVKIAYHDACHLAHAQGVRQQPRDLLRSIPGVELVPLAEPDMCCGSAGIYNLVEPEPARALGDRKAMHIETAAPDIVVTANAGCTLQIAAAARRRGRRLTIRHPIEILYASLRGAAP
jgi:glycolate dehydrogenase iron-sulfur subunit